MAVLFATAIDVTCGNLLKNNPSFRMMYRSIVTVSRTKGRCTLTATNSPVSFNRPLYTCPKDATGKASCHDRLEKKISASNMTIKRQNDGQKVHNKEKKDSSGEIHVTATFNKNAEQLFLRQMGAITSSNW